MMKNNNDYNVFFEKLTGFPPYFFQKKCGEYYFEENSFILNAPTGSGKTWASITPFIYSWYKWKNKKEQIEEFPRKLIYSLPLRTLANSLYLEVKEEIKNKFPELNLNITLQTGEYLNDPYFEGDIIFTTIDQTLGNILSIPLSLSKNMSNINAGAILSSYLIFDEFHLLEPAKSLNTVITLLKNIKDIVPFCLMTATLSKKFMEDIKDFLSAKLISVENDDYEKFNYVKNGARRIVSVNDNSLTADQIINFHKNKTIVICNTVDKCVNLFKKISNQKDGPQEIICLHSRFFADDRKNKEKEVLKYFGKNSTQKNVLLITTQVIEVGLDISCDTMLTEISPINSFLQRIGRCVRWSGEGNIQVFDCEETYLPYKAEISKTTYNELKNLENQPLNYFKSQELIESILASLESTIFNEIKNSFVETWNQMKNSWKTGDRSFARQLIRDIRSISIVLLPKGKKIKSLYSFESISMNPFSLKKKVENFVEEFGQDEPLLLGLVDNFIFDDELDSEEKELSAINFDSILNENIIALNSNIVGYSSSFGLDFNNNHKKSSKKNKLIALSNYTIYYDTFKEHINWMLKHLEVLIEYNYSIKKIQSFKYQNYDLNKAIEFMIKTHDYGKLNNLWQQIVKSYQEKKSGKEVNDFLAHTDFDLNNERDKEIMNNIFKELKVGKKPSHAGIGAFASFIMLPSILKMTKSDKEAESYLKVVSTAILRHHSSFATTTPSFTISDIAYKYFLELIKNTYKNISEKDFYKLPLKSFKGIKSDSLTLSFEKNSESFLYFIFVRILRLCDQHSFEYNPRTGGDK